MALSERLALLITANVDDAVKGFQKVGKEAEKNLGKAEDRLDKVGTNMTRIGVGAAGLGTVAAVGLYKLGQSASDLNETTSQSEQIFDSAAGKIEDFASGAAKSIGQSERAARDGANTFGLFFTNAGKSADEAASMSIELTKLASDMASFKNTSPEQAIEAIGAALRGESEPIRNYGVMLDDATLKQRALNMGLIETATGTLPPAIKQQAAYAEILAQTGTIQGDFARTSEGAANQQRILTAELENLKAGIGAGVLPVMTDLLGVVNGAVGAFSSLDESTQGTVGTVATYATGILIAGGATSAIIGQIIKARENFSRAKAAFDSAAVSLYDFSGSAKAAKAAQAGLIGAAAIGGYLVIDKAISTLSKSMQNVEGDIDDITSRLRVLANTGSNAGIDIDSLADSFRQLDSDSKSFMDRAKRFVLPEFDIAESDAAAADIDKIDKALANMVQGGSIREARAAYQGLKADLLAAGIPIQDIVRQFGDYDSALGTHMRNIRASSAAEREGADAATRVEGALTPAGEAARRAGEEFGGLRVSAAEAAPATNTFAGAIDVAAYNLGVAESALTTFNDAVDRYLGKTFGVQAANDDLLDAFDSLAVAARAAKGDFDGNSEAARAYRDASEEVVVKNAAVLQSMAENGASAAEVKKRQEELAVATYLQARAAGVGATEADELAAAVRGIPTGDYSYSFHLDAAEARAELDRLTAAFGRAGRASAGLSGLHLAQVVRANARAEGGPVQAGKPYIVGEKRPELFVPNQSGYVYPQVPAGRSGDRYFNITVNESASPQLTGRAIVAAIEQYERGMAGAVAAVE